MSEDRHVAFDADLCRANPEAAADMIEELQAKEVLANRAHRLMTEEIEHFQRNLRHWREECGKLHARVTLLIKQRDDAVDLSQEANRVLAAVRKVRDGYADQAKFADVDPACYFREFVQRLDAACLSKKGSVI